jgi:hypothetical protein
MAKANPDADTIHDSMIGSCLHLLGSRFLVTSNYAI